MHTRAEIVLSPTRIKRWVRCKKSYDWRYNQKLVRVRKEVPMSIGSVVSEVLADYYTGGVPRKQEDIDTSLKVSLEGIRPEAGLGKEVLDGYQKVRKITTAILGSYHEWASAKDDFSIVMIETAHQLQLTPNVFLMAIPDTNVVTPEEMPLILEHKVRYRYRPGDFGIDYQSVASCIVSNAIGTLYNVLEYGKGKFHREMIIRSEQELNYFKSMFIHIGEDILSTPSERMYPMPFKRCSCEYWELCNAEMQGLDIECVITELYRKTTGKPKVEEKPEEIPEE